MKTYPNQKVIHIQKRTYEDNFLQVGNDEWQRAARELSGSAFKLYLYLAGNKDGYDLALSQKAVENMIGLSKNTYHQAVKELEAKSYLSCVKGNVYVFSTSPSEVSTKNGYIPEIGTTQSWEGISPKLGEVSTKNGESILPKTGREIDKTYNIDKIDNEAEEPISPEGEDGASSAEPSISLPTQKSEAMAQMTEAERRESESYYFQGDWRRLTDTERKTTGRQIRDLTDDECREIRQLLDGGELYTNIERRYGMRSRTITKDFQKNRGLFEQAYASGQVPRKF